MIDRDAERRRNAVPTRDDIMKPTYTLHERRKAQDQDRIEAHKRAEVISLLTRTKGRAPTEAEISVALKR